MSTATMKRVIVRTDEIVLIDAPKPAPEPHEVLVETTVAGVCGSDTHAAAGHHPFVPLPYLPGHEVVGIVREIGTDVTTVKVGEHITVEPTLPCFTCKMCKTGRSNICENLRFFGCGYEQGGMADFFTIPANRIHIIPPGMSDLQAALIEPLSTPVHAVRLAGGVEGKAVVIIGAGTIGLLVLAAARYGGASKIVVTDMLHSKRERALRLGADAAIPADGTDLADTLRTELGESADVVFDCVSIQSTMDLSVKLASKGGIVMVVGVPAKPVTVALPEIQDLQVRIQGSATYMPEDYERSIEIIEAGHVPAEDFITSQYAFGDVASAFKASSGGQEVKVVLTRAAE